MKFTDGYWQLRPGVSMLRPRSIDEVVDEGERLVVHAPTAVVATRGDTLNQPVVTVTFDAPAEGVVGVRVEHHRGRRDPGPHFRVERSTPGAKVALPELI